MVALEHRTGLERRRADLLPVRHGQARSIPASIMRSTSIGRSARSQLARDHHLRRALCRSGTGAGAARAHGGLPPHSLLLACIHPVMHHPRRRAAGSSESADAFTDRITHVRSQPRAFCFARTPETGGRHLRAPVGAKPRAFSHASAGRRDDAAVVDSRRRVDGRLSPAGPPMAPRAGIERSGSAWLDRSRASAPRSVFPSARYIEAEVFARRTGRGPASGRLRAPVRPHRRMEDRMRTEMKRMIHFAYIVRCADGTLFTRICARSDEARRRAQRGQGRALHRGTPPRVAGLLGGVGFGGRRAEARAAAEAAAPHDERSADRVHGVGR